MAAPGSFIENNLLCSICWGSSIRARDSKKAGSVLGTALELIFKRLLQKLLNIKANAAPFCITQ